MSKTFDQGKDEIAKLCRYFAANMLDSIYTFLKN